MQPPGDIVCGEIGSADEQRWSAPASLSAEEREVIEALESDGIVETRAAAVRIEIAGTDHVGVVALSPRLRIHIRPKIGDVALLDWLAYVGDHPPLPPRPPGLGFALRGSFTEAIASHFLIELETLTRRSMRAEFAHLQQDSAAVRGKILPHALARSYHRLPRIPQSRRVRTLDTPHHRVLAAALDRLPSLLPPSDRITALRREWESIPRGVSDTGRAVADCLARCPTGYGSALRLASLVLLGARPSADGTAAAGTLLVSLASIWERAVRRMCAEVAEESGWRPVPDRARTKCWDDGPGFRDPSRWMTADVILTFNDRRWVLDAKYKRGYGDEERHDRFQMTAYAMAFDARRATLVYPTAVTDRPRWRLLLAGQIGGHSTTIDSIELPMSAGPAVCRRALLESIISLGPAQMKPRPARVILMDA